MKRLVLLLICALLVPCACLAEEIARPVYVEQYGVRWFEEVGKLGLEDANGNALVSARFDAAGPFTEEWVEGRPLARVRLNSRVGLVDPSGAFAIEPEWGSLEYAFGGAACAISDQSSNYQRSFVDIGSGVGLGFAARSADLLAPDRVALYEVRPGPGKVAADPRVQALLDAAKGFNGCILVDSQWNVLAKLNCDYVDAFREGAARAHASSGYGFIRTDGSWLSEPTWDYAEEFSEGFALVEQDDRHGYLKPDGSDAFATQWKYATSFRSGVAFVYDGPVGDMDSGPSVIADEWQMIDASGNVLLDGLGESYTFANGLARFEQAGLQGTRYGYFDASGKIAVEPMCRNAENFAADGLALVQEAGTGKYGFIDKTGALVIPCTLADARPFANGLAAFKGDNERWGFLDTKGNVVVEPIWGNAYNFEKPGYAGVLLESGWGTFNTPYWIDRSGGLLGKGDFDSLSGGWW
ncbi:MAG: WG repeat-containing protein [Clostridiales bacterium]|nr:WG repeat-containing protein [Clostridiales bacterium]